ncbi:shiga toxin 2 subunit A, partial [Escherichia coli]|nr:shiga toxin 2 subunit A [Escherichia coli]
GPHSELGANQQCASGVSGRGWCQSGENIL